MNRNLPYLPGLDGLRGLAVVAVIVYHADSRWLPGGFLGVEVFFVISGYLITLLLLDEHDRSGRIDLRHFYVRRARRLLPALLAMLVLLNVYAAIFRRDALGQIRGDVLAGLTYVSNWYQIWVGQSYTATGDFVPLRHLWSLAVEEQFYLVWPLVMIALLRHARREDRRAIGHTFASTAMAIAAFAALAYRPGAVGTCDTTPSAYWDVAGHCVSRTDVLYLSTPTRAGGLLLGAALALIRGPRPMRNHRRFGLEVAGVTGLVLLAVLVWKLHLVAADGPDRWLFRGGFWVTGMATVAVIAAAANPTVVGNRVLGAAPLVWIGLRSYGLYLFHWPIFQAVRRVAGNALTLQEFAIALTATVAITELSYRLLETPIRRRTALPWRPWLAPGAELGPRLAGIGAAIVLLFAVVSLAAAPLRQNEIALAQERAEAFVGDPFAATGRPAPVVSTIVPSTSTTVAPASTMTSTTMSTSTTTTSTVAPVAATAPATTPATATPTAPATSPSVPPTAPATFPPSAAPATAAPETQAPDGGMPATTVPLELGPAAPAALPGPCDATPIDRYALGDSVMVGAAEQLSAAGFCVDAAQSRFFHEGVERVARLAAEGRLGSTVVVSLGTNGLIDPADLHQMMVHLATVPRVVVVTAKADRPWVAPSNELLRSLPATYANVVVADWEWAAGSCPGSCFWDDGIHLRPDGRLFYAQLITDATSR